MKQQQYDVIIVGESLASRIAGALLCKNGCRVLYFGEKDRPLPGWLNASLHLEHLLEVLGGRSCYTSPAPFQVLTPSVRLEINGPIPLEEELRREFPKSHATVAALLKKLAQGGQRLEEILRKSVAAPLFGFSGRLLFPLRRMVARPGLGSLTRPFSDSTAPLSSDPEAREALLALFSGLSMTADEELSVGEAALLWHSCTRPSGVSSSGLDELLRHRFEQFHGETEEFADLQELTFKGRRPTGAKLKRGGGCTADHFLFAGTGAVSGLLPARGKEEASPAAKRLLTSGLDEKISPLLANRLVVAGSPPLRLTVGKRSGRTLCAMDFTAGADPTEETLRSMLAPVFPFADLTLSPPESTPFLPVASRTGRLLGSRTSLAMAPGASLCDGSLTLPSLGACGEALIGINLAERLLKRRKK